MYILKFPLQYSCPENSMDKGAWQARVHGVSKSWTAKEFQKNIYFCFIDYAKTFDCVDQNQLWKILKDGSTRPPDLPLEKPICRSGSNS